MGSSILKYFVTVNYFNLQVFSFGRQGGLGVGGLTPGPAFGNTGYTSVALPFCCGKGILIAGEGVALSD